jgi:hypothetical protein
VDLGGREESAGLDDEAASGESVMASTSCSLLNMEVVYLQGEKEWAVQPLLVGWCRTEDGGNSAWEGNIGGWRMEGMG